MSSSKIQPLCCFAQPLSLLIAYFRNINSGSGKYGEISSESSSETEALLQGKWMNVKTLKNSLYASRIECQKKQHFIVPQCALERLITVSAVASDLRDKDPRLTTREAKTAARDICMHARQLYATLVCIQKTEDIGSLLNEGIYDSELPLFRAQNRAPDFALCSRQGERILVMDSWDTDAREGFDRIQWWMIAPVFKYQEHLELESESILPFIPYENPKVPDCITVGGYSDVYCRRLHPSHHKFWETSGCLEDEPLVAVKQLRYPEKEEFEREKEILLTLGAKQHPHLIKLLATYQWEQKWHLIFPWADGNLRAFWAQEPFPKFTRETLLWSLKQISGIAGGLNLIHNLTPTIPQNVTDPSNTRLQKDRKISLKRGEERFGRHGDIKPENILWFKNGPGPDNTLGVLQIGDFGLGRFHGRDSRSKVNPSKLAASPTYEPPEIGLRRLVSREYDQWGLGCLYLEFVTWLLEGDEAIRKFGDFRGVDNSMGINDDYFFTLNDDGTDAVVRERVQEWAIQLRANEKCSEALQKLLNIIMNELLVIDSKKRCKANDLNQKLKKLYKRAEEDMDFLLKPAPRQNTKEESMSSVNFEV